MDKIIIALVKANEQLSQIAVRGDDVYRMVNARNYFNAALGMLQKLKTEHDSAPDPEGGDAG